MDDGLAREGVLTRCNQSRDETLHDEECNNARRAASTLALEAERARAPALEQQSEAKLLAMRERHPDAAVTESASSSPTFGSPVGSVLPSMSRSPSFDVYADGSSGTLDRPTPEIAAEPPTNDLVITAPALEVPELAVVPRPFRGETVQP